MNPSPSERSSDAAPPPAAIRSGVSLWLTIHATCVAVALAANLAPSALESEFLRIVGPYVSGLGFDPNGTPVYMTHGEFADVDWRLEWLAPEADESEAESWQIALPTAGNLVGWERHRQQSLLREFGLLATDDESPDADSRAAALAQAIAAYLVRERQLSVRSIRLRRHTLQPPDAITSPDPDDRNPDSERFFDVVYHADVVMDGDRVEIIRRAGAQEEARTRGASP